MQKVFLLLMVMLLNGKSIEAQVLSAQSNIESKLLQLNLSALLDKPVDSLLSKVPSQDSTLKITSGGSMFVGAGLIISYLQEPTKYFIYITLGELHFLNPSNPNRLPAYQAWPFNLLRKEKITKITIYKGVDIMKEAVYNENPLE